MSFSPDSAYAAFWLEVARSDLAVWMQLTPYVYAALEGIHLVGVAFFFGSIFLLDLRLLGFMPQLLAGPAGRLLLRICNPAFVLLAISGALMFVPSADRYAVSPIFFIKMAAIGVGGVNALAFHLGAWRSVNLWDGAARFPWTARATAVVSVVVWISVIALGRGMGYERRQPPQIDFEFGASIRHGIVVAPRREQPNR